MKNVISMWILLFPLLGFSQYDIPGNYTIGGNVGVGTSNPTSNLHLLEDGNLVILSGYSYRNAAGGFGILGWGARGSESNPIALNENDNALWLRGMGFDGYDYHRIGHIGFKVESISSGSLPGYLTFETNDGEGTHSLVERMRIGSNGNIGIGTTSPNELLDIEGDLEFGIGTDVLKIKQGDFSYEGSERPYIFHDRGTNRKIGLGITDNQSVRNYIELFEGNVPNNQYIDFGIQGTSAMKINSEGEVAIGTTDFSGNHKLRVEGSIGAREVKVEASGWSDFVFKDDYELQTLEEVEQHIIENGHLPEIPNEAEVSENGINLGEMNAKLLQKIEELTLYLIEQNKQNQAQQDEIEALKSRLNLLE